MDVSSIASAATTMSTARLAADVSVAVLDNALETTTNAALALVNTMSIPAGLTYGPDGLSAGATSTIDRRI